jgi:hypothetical protein
MCRIYRIFPNSLIFSTFWQEAKEKGKKMNYEVEEIQNVYDLVDEADYAEEVGDLQVSVVRPYPQGAELFNRIQIYCSGFGSGSDPQH